MQLYYVHMQRSKFINVSLILEKNKQLIDVAEQHNQWTEELCQQLQREVNKSKDIEAQLQFNNHLLEQKVRERT